MLYSAEKLHWWWSIIATERTIGGYITLVCWKFAWMINHSCQKPHYRRKSHDSLRKNCFDDSQLSPRHGAIEKHHNNPLSCCKDDENKCHNPNKERLNDEKCASSPPLARCKTYKNGITADHSGVGTGGQGCRHGEAKSSLSLEQHKC